MKTLRQDGGKMALKYVNIPGLTPLEAGILKKVGLNVINDKLFIDEGLIKADKPSVGRKSKAKGGKFERAVVTALSLWWTNGQDKNAFSKTPRSGAWKFPQDIVPPADCPFLISCKNEERWTGVEKTLFTDSHRFVCYWGELMESMTLLHREKKGLFVMTTGVPIKKVIPMVVLTRNHDPNYLILKERDLSMLQDFSGLYMKHQVKFILEGKYQATEIKEVLTMVMLDDFLSYITPEALRLYNQSEAEKPMWVLDSDLDFAGKPEKRIKYYEEAHEAQ